MFIAKPFTSLSFTDRYIEDQIHRHNNATFIACSVKRKCM